VRTLLAWAYVETGAGGKAGPLLDAYPLPLSSGESLFASLIFPRYLFLRGTVLLEAKNLQLYAKYGGPDQISATE
jgi:hypothetical protein